MSKNTLSITDLTTKAFNASQVESELYTRYDVKRGLRDINGKGVLAGLTQIGDVRANTPASDGTMTGPGSLIYRGIEINDLVGGFLKEKRNGFEETAYLLLFGDLPDSRTLESFDEMLREQRTLPFDFIHDSALKLPSRDIMNGMAQTLLSLYTLDDKAESTELENVVEQSIRLIGIFPVLAAYCYRAYAYRFLGKSLIIHPPSPTLATAANFLQMMRKDKSYTPLEERLLDLCLVLHAEHGGGNNSSFTTHVVTSSGTDTYSAITAALCSLKGPRHGGANIRVGHMFEDIKKSVKNWASDTEVGDYLDKIVRKEAFDRTGLIYGIGHAVYSVSDPRATILRQQVSALAAEKGMEAEFDLYQRVERLAPEVIGRHRKIYKGVSANVDFYSGLLYRMLGIPSELYTPIFAISRIVGWSAHRIEELANRGKIIRPAYLSVAKEHSYIPVGQRPGF